MHTTHTGWIIEHSGAGSLPDADAWADRVLVRLGGAERARAAYLAIANGDPTWDDACREALRELCAGWATVPECTLVPSGWDFCADCGADTSAPGETHTCEASP